MPDRVKAVDIVLVEDNATDAELCMRALRKQNLANNVVWVKDGAEALELLLPDADCGESHSITPKVVLLDLRLPKVDGLEVLRKIKADERTRMLPVVVLTSSKEDNEVAEAYKLGANSFITKPVAFDDFVDRMTSLGYYWLVVNRFAA